MANSYEELSTDKYPFDERQHYDNLYDIPEVIDTYDFSLHEDRHPDVYICAYKCGALDCNYVTHLIGQIHNHFRVHDTTGGAVDEGEKRYPTNGESKKSTFDRRTVDSPFACPHGDCMYVTSVYQRLHRHLKGRVHKNEPVKSTTTKNLVYIYVCPTGKCSFKCEAQDVMSFHRICHANATFININPTQQTLSTTWSDSDDYFVGVTPEDFHSSYAYESFF